MTLSSRSLVINAQRYWPEYITTMFWTFALVAYADRMNNIHVDMNGKTPEIKIPDTIGSTAWINNFHTFGCLIYILDSRLQRVDGRGPQACLGIYLGHSSSHAESVAFVMNPKSGLVSTQFYLVFDDNCKQYPIFGLEMFRRTGQN